MIKFDSTYQIVENYPIYLPVIKNLIEWMILRPNIDFYLRLSFIGDTDRQISDKFFRGTYPKLWN